MRALFFLVLCFPLFAHGQRFVLSEESEIRIMTMGPGQEELYSAFGHSGIRLTDPVAGVDWVYNYGIFDFNQPNFYLNFAKGRLLYKLGKSDYDRTIQYYAYFNRYIKEQVLNLSLEERQKLFDFLEVNYLPENRDYYYNYIYDNCATKIRDVLEAVFPEQIAFDESYLGEPLSYRDLMDIYLGQQPWGDLGIDICLGVQIDAEAPARDYMYLPDFVFQAFQKATIKIGDTTKPLISEFHNVYVSKPAPDASSPITPIAVFVVIFLLVGVASHRELKYGLWYRWLDVTLFVIVGVVGCLLLFLWFGTDHLSKYNLNLLWAIPSHLVVGLLLLRKPLIPKLKMYFLLTGAVQVVTILAWGILPQALHLALVPLVLLLALRALLLWGRHLR